MDTPLYGFSNQPVIVEGIIPLPVAIGTPPMQANFMLDFVVVKVPSAYNDILGRTALNRLQAVVSTYHLKMKFPTKHGVGEVKGYHTTTRKCYMASCRSKNKEALIIEDLQEDTKMQRGKLVEELVSNEVYPGKENKTVRIALGRFMARSAERCLPFFKAIKKAKNFAWTDDCQKSFEELKTYLSSPPLFSKPLPGEDLFMYLSVTKVAVSIILVREEDGVQKPIYYVSKVLQDVETRYPKIDKIALALFISARRLRSYFQSHTIVVLTDQPLRKVLLSLETSKRLVNWSVELGEFDIQYKSLTAIKAQALADFIVECTSPEDPPQLLSRDYEARDERMAQYLELVKTSASNFKNFTIHQIPRDQNTQADTLSRLASAEVTDVRRSVYLEFLKKRSISSQNEIGIIDKEPCWMDMIIKYMSTGELPSERQKAKNLRVKAARYALVDGILYKKSFSLPYLKCLCPSESLYALQEVHEGICGQHLGGRTLAHKILWQGYYWPMIQKDAIEFTRRWDKCQKFSPVTHTPIAPLTPVVSPIPFPIWGMDLLGFFPMASGQRKFVIVAIDYFTKWTEAESLATITSAKCEDFF
ncbi:hypothetical protein RJ639_009731 [Escallonia herrerae]|uniref:Reverse transcriptase/retrotransposon-derived protein RNase H-like domain-containing protein n=1 Tax=Escallonia herrerae TaxID=1293975 RepID=A0AA88VPB8_9ASTE|nr:hypothetical protein RJ639_009731 [Escallonia herrerae]